LALSSNDGTQPAAIEVPLSAELDLHTFSPSDVPSLVDEYIRACREKGLLSVRIIHGRGKGVQRARVRQLLGARADVLSYSDAPPTWGFWGATIVRLAPLAGESSEERRINPEE
jgi:DNA-nicking Smr family endonuclease